MFNGQHRETLHQGIHFYDEILSIGKIVDNDYFPKLILSDEANIEIGGCIKIEKAEYGMTVFSKISFSNTVFNTV